MRRVPYVLMDVFTSKPLEGNQLAVITDARRLNDSEMQRIAKETNLSETTFILPRDAATEKKDGVKVRIFTTAEELPFAGHPTLGTATVIRGESGAARVELDLKVGKIPVTFEDCASGGPAFGEMRQRDPEFGPTHARETIAAIGGLSPDDIRDDVPIQTVSTGLAFTIVPLKSLAAAQRLRLDPRLAEEYAGHSDGRFFFWVATETVDPKAKLHARMIFYNGEDPATGSASGCCIAWAVRYGVVNSGERVMIEQGVEMNRPSRLYVRADKNGDSAANVRVGGSAVEVARGEFLLP